MKITWQVGSAKYGCLISWHEDDMELFSAVHWSRTEGLKNLYMTAEYSRVLKWSINNHYGTLEISSTMFKTCKHCRPALGTGADVTSPCHRSQPPEWMKVEVKLFTICLRLPFGKTELFTHAHVLFWRYNK